ncbi:hypothetical protein MHU86_5359 [Fragilaria crotonensis]|nr:hypothetical protein MHU86_5359 [Fragilaria crotonensis]
MGLFQSKERQQQQQDAAELDEWFADVQRIKQQCCDDPWYQHKLAISKTTVEVADEYVGTQSDINALFPGVHKYLGGAKDERDGCIYGIPSHARSVICLYPTRESKTATTNNEEEVRYKIRLEPLPEHAANGQFKWLRGIIAHGYLYGIPAWANTVLQVDIDAMWGDDRMRQGRFNKWYGGLLGDDNAVYGIPYRTCSLLRIDTETDTAAIVGEDYGCKRFNWHGGAKVNGFIYAYPSHADTVLRIDTSLQSKGTISTRLPIQRASYDVDTNQNYKWLGGAIGADGNIYAMPADASAILKIDTHTNICSTFGFVGTEKNKWQGGVLSPTDGCIYCIPADGQHVLRIATSPSSTDTTTATRPSSGDNDDGADTAMYHNAVSLVGQLPNRKNKWQGAFFGNDGIMYAIPENGYRILMVRPSHEQRNWKTGEVVGDVRVELM